MSDALEIWRLTGEISRLRALNAELVEALRFYADAWVTYRDAHPYGSTVAYETHVEATEALYEDAGERAAAALAKAEENGVNHEREV